jgi:hypothetical protein
MIHISRPTLFAALAILAAASPAAAQQQPASSSPRVYGGLSVGPQIYPNDLRRSCDPGTFGVGEARVGARAGLFAVEVRGTAALAHATTSCAVLDAPSDADVFPPPEDGIHTFREYGYDSRDPEGSLDARLRLGGTQAVPVVFAVGGGRLMGPGVSYGVASVGFRSRGTTRVAVDLEGSLYHMPYDQVQVERQGGEVVRTLSRESVSRWSSGAGLRVGIERELF